MSLHSTDEYSNFAYCSYLVVHCIFKIYFFLFFSSIRRHTRCALVTGVQTCALPISRCARVTLQPCASSVRHASRRALVQPRLLALRRCNGPLAKAAICSSPPSAIPHPSTANREAQSEERRAGKEFVSTSRSRGLPCPYKQNLNQQFNDTFEYSFIIYL